jgi:hypothetical protein
MTTVSAKKGDWYFYTFKEPELEFYNNLKGQETKKNRVVQNRN